MFDPELARKAEEIMMRRKWSVLINNKGWTVGNTGWTSHYAEFVVWRKSQSFEHPFVALVEADRWLAGQEKQNGV